MKTKRLEELVNQAEKRIWNDWPIKQALVDLADQAYESGIGAAVCKPQPNAAAVDTSNWVRHPDMKFGPGKRR